MTTLQQDAAYRETLATRGYDACRARWSEEVVIGRLLDYVAEGLDRR
jgi:hypothetical protein